MVTRFTIFQSRIPKWLLSNCEAVNKCEDKKGGVLSVLDWCEKEAYSASGMESNLCLFVKLRI